MHISVVRPKRTGLFPLLILPLIVLGILGHECQRDCQSSNSPKTCTYHFDIEYYFTLSKACFDCPLIVEDCDRHHCIAADGVERGITVVNRQLPGPSIQVCEGDEIIVDVKNRLPGEGSSIHWHGQHMVGTPYMDGVPMVTQCPITPGSTFRYQFIAQNPGTHFWHSHTGFQRADGVFGPLIVRQNKEQDPHGQLYDMDFPDHVIVVFDWLHELAVADFVVFHHDEGGNIPTAMLVNGKGRLPRPYANMSDHERMPLAKFQVQQNRRYRFRMMNTGFLGCPVQVSIDNHTLLVIASDGNPLEPIEVDSLVISAGERFDFILHANQSISSYWIRFHGLVDCTFNKVYQTAILHYQGARDVEPTDQPNYENTARSGKILNPINLAPGDDTHVTMAEVRLYDTYLNISDDWTREPDQKFYLAFDYNPINNTNFHDPEHYPIFSVKGNHNLYTPQINNISLRMPPSPLLSQYADVAIGLVCNDSTVSNCGKEFCECTYTLNVPLGSLVELILIDEGVVSDSSHPFHLHGTAFRVVAMNRVGSSVTVERIKEMDRLGMIQRNFDNAPMKDTVVVPDGGYTIIRFTATNPGYWLFHCHLVFHIDTGMGLIFKVGHEAQFPPAPKDFPKCGDFKNAVPSPSSGTVNVAILIYSFSIGTLHAILNLSS